MEAFQVHQEWQLLTPLAETEPTMIALATTFMPLILIAIVTDDKGITVNL